MLPGVSAVKATKWAEHFRCLVSTDKGHFKLIIYEPAGY